MRLALAMVMAFGIGVLGTGIALAAGQDSERAAYQAWCANAGGTYWSAQGMAICTIGDLPDDAYIDHLIDQVHPGD